MNSEPNAMTRRNHWDSGMPAATPPAMARLAATQRREPAWLVLAVAAAYGLDPTDPARAADLRELTIHSGRIDLEGRARARYSQET